MPVRWTLRAASHDFDIHRETLTKRLALQGIVCGEDECFSTADICKAIYGDLDGEKLLLTREQRIKAERENATAAKQLIPADVVERVWSSTIIEFRQRVLGSGIDGQLKKELLEILTETTRDEYFAAAIKSLETDTQESDGP